jgi:hypothetical protein
MLLGPIIYWYVFLRKSAEDSKRLAAGVIDAFWRAFAVQYPRPKARLKR